MANAKPSYAAPSSGPGKSGRAHFSDRRAGAAREAANGPFLRSPVGSYVVKPTGLKAPVADYHPEQGDILVYGGA